MRLPWIALLVLLSGAALAQPQVRKTVVDIKGDAFWVNGEPTYKGRVYNGMKVEGLLLFPITRFHSACVTSNLPM